MKVLVKPECIDFVGIHLSHPHLIYIFAIKIVNLFQKQLICYMGVKE